MGEVRRLRGTEDDGDGLWGHLGDGREAVAGVRQPFVSIGPAEEPVFTHVRDGDVVGVAGEHQLQKAVRREAAASKDRLVDRVSDPIGQLGGFGADVFAHLRRQRDNDETGLFAGVRGLDAAPAAAANDGDSLAFRCGKQGGADHQVEKLLLVPGFDCARLAEGSRPELGRARQGSRMRRRRTGTSLSAACLVNDHGLPGCRCLQSFEETAAVRDTLHVGADDRRFRVAGEVVEHHAGGDVEAVAVVRHLAEAQSAGGAARNCFDGVVAALAEEGDATGCQWEVRPEGDTRRRVV
ncbi:MAG: hypothetical protein C0506_11390 [Anaerolinea sp.]|nr:hypothetical protein [Anaerolinea sp.]